MQKSKYKRPGNQERESISRGLAQKKSILEIARELGRSPYLVIREIIEAWMEEYNGIRPLESLQGLPPYSYVGKNT